MIRYQSDRTNHFVRGCYETRVCLVVIVQIYTHVSDFTSLAAIDTFGEYQQCIWIGVLCALIVYRVQLVHINYLPGAAYKLPDFTVGKNMLCTQEGISYKDNFADKNDLYWETLIFSINRMQLGELVYISRQLT